MNEGLSRMNEGLSRMNIRPSFGRGGGIRNEHANVNGRHNDSGNNNNGKSDELKIRGYYYYQHYYQHYYYYYINIRLLSTNRNIYSS